jgi:hypothetical protein
MLYRGSLDGFNGLTLRPGSTGVPQAEQNAARSAKAAPQLLQNIGIDRAPGIWAAYIVQRHCSTPKSHPAMMHITGVRCSKDWGCCQLHGFH